MVWAKLHCRRNESLRLLWAPPLPGTCIFSSWALGNQRRERVWVLYVWNQILDFSPISFSLLPPLSSFSFFSASHSFPHPPLPWRQQRRLISAAGVKRRRAPGHRAKRVCKAGLIPLKCYFTCPQSPSSPPVIPHSSTLRWGWTCKEAMLGSYDIADFKGDTQIPWLHKTLTVPACWITAAQNWSLFAHFLFFNWGAHAHFLNWTVLFIQTLLPGLCQFISLTFLLRPDFKNSMQNACVVFQIWQFTLFHSKYCTNDAVWLTNSWCKSVNKTHFNVGMPRTFQLISTIKSCLWLTAGSSNNYRFWWFHTINNIYRHPCIVLLNQLLFTSCCSSTYWFKAGICRLQLFDPSATALCSFVMVLPF